MNDARELLVQYADGPCTHLSVEGGSAGYGREEFAPKAFDSLRVVLDLCDEAKFNAPGYQDIVSVRALRAEIAEALTGGSDD